MRESDLLRYDERDALYSLGPQILTLSAAARAGMPVIEVAGRYMRRLVRETGETVVLSVWDGDHAVVVRADDNTDRTTRVSVRTGSRLPRTRSAQGLVFCAFLPADEIPGLDERLRDDPDLRRELARIRRDGICSYAAPVSGVRSIAAPVFRGEVLVAAMAVVGTTAWVPDGPGSAQANALRRTAADVSAELGD